MSFNVVIVPGILGSMLYRDGRLIYPNPFRFRDLKYDPKKPDDGTSPEKALARSYEDHYHKLAKELGRKHRISGVESGPYQVFWAPYDWRRPVEGESERLADYISKIPEGPVAIVAHSMGGLVAKHFLLFRQPVRDRVQYLFTVGTPWLGAPDALDYLANDAKLLGFVTLRTQQIAQTLPSVYQLVTSRRYFDRDTEQPYSHPLSLTYQQVRQLANLHSPTEDYYDVYNVAGLQSWVYAPLPDSVRHCAIVGTGLPTSVAVDLVNGKYRTLTGDQAGDGRVPLHSAEWGETEHRSVIRFVEHVHGTLCAATPVWKWVKYTLATGEPEAAQIDGLYKRPVSPSGDRILIECPVDVLVTGQEPLMAGMLGDYVINTLPDASVEPFGTDGKLIELPLGLENYSVSVRGTGKGHMTIRHMRYRDGNVTLSIFNRVAIAPETIGEMCPPENGHTVLRLITQGSEPRYIQPNLFLQRPYEESHAVEVAFYDREGPIVHTRVGNRPLESEEPLWLRGDTPKLLDVTAEDMSGLHTLEWSHDRANWQPYLEPIPLPENRLTRIYLKATDLAGNVTERAVAVGHGHLKPTCRAVLTGKQLNPRAFIGEAAVHFEVSSHWAPISCIWVSMNGQDKHRHDPGKPLVLTQAGRYQIKFQPEDAAGNLADPSEIDFLITAAVEIAATTTLVEQTSRQGGSIRSLRPDLRVTAIEVDGQPYDLDTPLPLVADECRVTLQVGENDTVQIPVQLSAKVKWLKPVIDGACFTHKETACLKFQISSGRDPVDWHGRVTAVLQNLTSKDEEVLPVDYSMELQAGLVVYPCAQLRIGKYRIELRTNRYRLDRQSFEVV